MTYVSVTQLKTNPSKAVRAAVDAPVAVQKRNKTKAYLVGSELFEQMVSYIEDISDKKAVEETNFSEGRDFEDLASELGV
jgi:PHD/YefM family antitoxin component YafN of YafNO toxin-antitoxin module